MAIVTRQEFAEMCAIDMDSLRSYISRKKIIVQGEGGKQIDTTHAVNKAFKEKRKAQAQIKKDETELLRRVAMNPNKSKPAEDPEFGDTEEDPLPPPLDENMINAYLLEKRGKRDHPDDDGPRKWLLMKMRGDAELVSVRVIKENLLLEKAAGKLLPVDNVMNIHKAYAKNFLSHFENGIENIASMFCNIMAGGDMGMYTRITEQAKQLLATCINDAGKQTEEDIDRLIDEYSETRARGEKKV